MSEQGTAYCQLVTQELDAQRSRRTTTLERLARIQQSAALPVALVAAAGSIVPHGSRRAALLLSTGALILVVAVLIASIGITRNASLLAKPGELERIIREGWEDDEVDARYAIALHQIAQTSDLAKNNARLHRWSSVSGGFQVLGLLVVGAGAVSILLT